MATGTGIHLKRKSPCGAGDELPVPTTFRFCAVSCKTGRAKNGILDAAVMLSCPPPLIDTKDNTLMSRSATPQHVCPNTETATSNGAPQRHSPGRVTTLLPDRLPADQVRVSMNRVILGWAFGAAFMNVSAGAVYVAFARHIGANDQVFGILAAALPLMSFLQVISARLVESSGQRKRQMLTTGIIGRSLWIPAALTPIVAHSTSGPISQWLGQGGIFGSTRVLDVVVACVLLSSAVSGLYVAAVLFLDGRPHSKRVRPHLWPGACRWAPLSLCSACWAAAG
jgi:hypothetical protein